MGWAAMGGHWQPPTQAAIRASYLLAGTGGSYESCSASSEERARALCSTRVPSAWHPSPPTSARQRGHQASASSGSPDDRLGGPCWKPSEHLRQLMDTVASSEAWLETLQDENHRLRVRCLQQMRGATLLGTMRGPFLEWSGLCSRLRRQAALEDVRSRLLGRSLPLIARALGGARQPSVGHVLRAWRKVLGAVAVENGMLAEIEAHRQGRGRVMQQYHELEAALDAERHLSAELQARCQESRLEVDRLQEELSWTSSRLASQARETEEQGARARTLNEQLRESQDRVAELKKELRARSERTRRLELQAEQDEEERQELHDALARAERATEAARGSAQLAREHEAGRAEALLRQRDERIATLEAQLADARGCVESLSRSAGAFLVRGAEARGAPSSAGALSARGPAADAACGTSRSRRGISPAGPSAFAAHSAGGLMRLPLAEVGDLRAGLVR